jgi:hypothetical protein
MCTVTSLDREKWTRTTLSLGRVRASSTVLIGVGTPILGLPHQGSAVALSADGNTALIGGPGQLYETGAAYVFTRSNGAWQQEQVLIGLPSFVLSQERKGAIVAPIGLEYGGNQGYAVALSATGCGGAGRGMPGESRG